MEPWQLTEVWSHQLRSELLLEEDLLNIESFRNWNHFSAAKAGEYL